MARATLHHPMKYILLFSVFVFGLYAVALPDDTSKGDVAVESLADQIDRIVNLYRDAWYAEVKARREQEAMMADAIVQLIKLTGKNSVELDEQPSRVGPPYPVPEEVVSPNGFTHWLHLNSGIPDTSITVTEPKHGTWTIYR
jgi:hypothetical protein